jgi:hypothetical protein
MSVEKINIYFGKFENFYSSKEGSLFYADNFEKFSVFAGEFLKKGGRG